MNDLKELLGVSEEYQVPGKLMDVMMDRGARVSLLSHIDTDDEDWLTDYFETFQSDRKNFAQDYTPNAVSRLTAMIAGESRSILDVCSGIGGLSAKAHEISPECYIRTQELSKASLPFQLLNMCMSNANCDIMHMDVLTNEVKKIYHLTSGKQFSDITEANEIEDMKFDAVLMNPPYSLKFDRLDEFKDDERFSYGPAPKSKSDWMFVEHGLYYLNDGGVLVAILPHGVLFRGQRELEIRKRIIDDNLLEAVIGLPEKLFMNTDIPTVIMVLRKNRRDRSTLIIDASKEYEHVKNRNVMHDSHIQKIYDCYKSFKEIDKFSKVIHIGDIQDNGYNLNIPRYVDTYEREPVPDIGETLDEMAELEEKLDSIDLQILQMMKELVGTTPESQKEIKKATARFERIVRRRNRKAVDQMSMEDMADE